MARETLESMPIPRPDPHRVKQHECLDKGYDFAEMDALMEEMDFIAHIRRKGEKLAARKARFKARRWVSERTHSWLNRFRRILVRWEKKPENYLGMLHLALSIIIWRFVLSLSG